VYSHQTHDFYSLYDFSIISLQPTCEHLFFQLAQYPYRSVQIVLRLYRSPAEALAGFDVDAPCCAYDGMLSRIMRNLSYAYDLSPLGEHVWANPRAITAMIRQSNTVDVSRRSPSYEIRLQKYAKRGFEVYVPNLRREDVDPTARSRHLNP
jgi:hypothetical protein